MQEKKVILPKELYSQVSTYWTGLFDGRTSGETLLGAEGARQTAQSLRQKDRR